MDAGSNGNIAVVLLLLGLLVIAATTLLSTQRHLRRQSRNKGAGSQRSYPKGSVQSSEPAMLAEWEIRLEERARDILGEINSKIRMLNILIEQAERVAERLETALEQSRTLSCTELAGNSPPRYDSAKTNATASATASHPAQLDVDNNGPTKQDEGLTTDTTGRTLGSGSNKREEVYLLADYGFSPLDIAKRLSIPVGEVELMLRLRKAG